MYFTTWLINYMVKYVTTVVKRKINFFEKNYFAARSGLYLSQCA
jgi:hypothetical protein